MIILIPLSMIPAFMPLIKMLTTGSKDLQKLKQTGQKRLANIVNVEDTGISVNKSIMVNLTVETTSGNTAKFQKMVPRVQIPRVGDKIEVLIDPADPTIAMAAN